jgi:hypothetical protein
MLKKKRVAAALDGIVFLALHPTTYVCTTYLHSRRVKVSGDDRTTNTKRNGSFMDVHHSIAKFGTANMLIVVELYICVCKKQEERKMKKRKKKKKDE